MAEYKEERKAQNLITNPFTQGNKKTTCKPVIFLQERSVKPA